MCIIGPPTKNKIKLNNTHKHNNIICMTCYLFYYLQLFRAPDNSKFQLPLHEGIMGLFHRPSVVHSKVSGPWSIKPSWQVNEQVVSNGTVSALEQSDGLTNPCWIWNFAKHVFISELLTKENTSFDIKSDVNVKYIRKQIKWVLPFFSRKRRPVCFWFRHMASILKVKFPSIGLTTPNYSCSCLIWFKYILSILC